MGCKFAEELVAAAGCTFIRTTLKIHIISMHSFFLTLVSLIYNVKVKIYKLSILKTQSIVNLGL